MVGETRGWLDEAHEWPLREGFAAISELSVELPAMDSGYSSRDVAA